MLSRSRFSRLPRPVGRVLVVLCSLPPWVFLIHGVLSRVVLVSWVFFGLGLCGAFRWPSSSYLGRFSRFLPFGLLGCNDARVLALVSAPSIQYPFDGGRASLRRFVSLPSPCCVVSSSNHVSLPLSRLSAFFLRPLHLALSWLGLWLTVDRAIRFALLTCRVPLWGLPHTSLVCPFSASPHTLASYIRTSNPTTYSIRSGGIWRGSFSCGLRGAYRTGSCSKCAW